MGILDFICVIIVTTMITVTIIGVVGLKYNTEKLEKENEKLRAKLKKSKKEDK